MYSEREKIILRATSTAELCELYRNTQDEYVKFLLETRLFEYDLISENKYNEEMIDLYYKLKQQIYETIKR